MTWRLCSLSRHDAVRVLYLPSSAPALHPLRDCLSDHDLVVWLRPATRRSSSCNYATNPFLIVCKPPSVISRLRSCHAISFDAWCACAFLCWSVLFSCCTSRSLFAKTSSVDTSLASTRRRCDRTRARSSIRCLTSYVLSACLHERVSHVDAHLRCDAERWCGLVVAALTNGPSTCPTPWISS